MENIYLIMLSGKIGHRSTLTLSFKFCSTYMPHILPQKQTDFNIKKG